MKNYFSFRFVLRLGQLALKVWIIAAGICQSVVQSPRFFANTC